MIKWSNDSFHTLNDCMIALTTQTSQTIQTRHPTDLNQLQLATIEAIAIKADLITNRPVISGPTNSLQLLLAS